MKRLMLTLASILTAALASAQTEGVADFKMTSGESMQGTGRMYFAKGGYRSDWSMEADASGSRSKSKGGKAATTKLSMIGRASEPDVVYMVNDETKSYTVWDAKKARDEASKSKDKYTIERLGTDTVGGISCQNVRVKSSNGADMEVCMAKDIAAPAGWLSAMGRNAGGASWVGEMHAAGVDGFPIRWITRSGRSEKTTMELTKFERKAVPASTFAIPAGYEKTDPMSVGLNSEQRKQLDDAMSQMTPEQRKQVEEMMKQHGQPTPRN